MRLYHMPGSRSTRVLWMLEEIGVPYEVTLMTREERKTAEHIVRHPLGRVPVVELDDGSLLFESAAICMQLADLHPEAGADSNPGVCSAGAGVSVVPVRDDRARATCISLDDSAARGS
jgi:glutathione S-transferase